MHTDTWSLGVPPRPPDPGLTHRDGPEPAWALRHRIADWELALTRLQAQAAELQAAGRWTSGPNSLLGALGVPEREPEIARALGWVLTPDGKHRLGERYLRLFLRHLGVQIGDTPLFPTSVLVGEQRDGTTADLVVRCAAQTVVLTTCPPEDVERLSLLAELWAHERPRLVILLRRDRPQPLPEGWQPLLWRQVAKQLRRAAAQVPIDLDRREGVAPGVQDLITTLSSA